MRKISATVFTAVAIGALSGASAHSATAPAGSPTAKVDGTGRAVVTAGVGTSNAYTMWMGCYAGGRCFFHVGLATGKAGPRPVLGSACFDWSNDSTEWVFFCDTYASGGATVTFGNGSDYWSVQDFGGWPGGVKVYGGGGADHFTALGAPYPEKLYGQAGADYLDGSPSSSDVLSGGTESDHIFGGDGDDVIRGGAGPDFLRGDAGGDRIEGDAGDDEIHGDGYSESPIGGDDTIDGGTGNDHIFGGAGGDNIYGGDGADVVDVGAVHCDIASGGAGNDQIFSSVGAPGSCSRADFFGNSGNDKLGRLNSNAANWSMTLVGGEGNDTLYANDYQVESDLDCGDGTADKAYVDDGSYDPAIVDQTDECETVY